MENSWAAEYRIGDHVYSIYEESQIHARLSTDETFLNSYVAESTGNPELVAVVNADAVDGPGVKTFKSDARATKYFLDIYRERKDKFRDPKIRKKTLWSEMAQDMNLRGYNVDEDILDRKIRNMKKTYKTIKDNNNKNSTGRGRITWEYFDVFEEIFSSDRTVNCGPVVSSMAVSDVADQLNSSVMSSSTSYISPSPVSMDEDEPPHKMKKTNAAKSVHSLYYMRKKMIEAEERKAAASEELNRVFTETNKLLQERNELLRRFLETRSSGV